MDHKSDPTENLEVNGATEEEIEFLRGERVGLNHYRGRRVELNAFTSNQFIEWLEQKLDEHGVTKVIPDAATLEHAYRRAAGHKRCRAILERAVAEVDAYAAGVKVPKGLRKRVQAELDREPGQSWDSAIESLLPPAKLDK